MPIELLHPDQLDPRAKDRSGQQFNNLTCLLPVNDKASNGAWKWLCVCECGELAVIENIGKRKSCGCSRRQKRDWTCPYCGETEYGSDYQKTGHLIWCEENPNADVDAHRKASSEHVKNSEAFRKNWDKDEEQLRQQGEAMREWWSKPENRELQRQSHLGNQSHLGHSHSEETKRIIAKKIRAHIKENGTPFERTESYSGISFYSQTEVTFAKWLDHRGVDWEYEPEWIEWEMEDGESKMALPDFYVPEDDVYYAVGISGNDTPEKTERRKGIERASNTSVVAMPSRKVYAIAKKAGVV